MREPRTGNDLVLTLDAGVQSAGESAIGQFGLPGGFVAMNVNNGEIIGMGSTPTYDPSLFAQPVVTPATYKQIFGDPKDPLSTLAAPAVNRASQGVYPTGSTFKPITAVAALDAGNLTPERTIADGGSVEYGGVTFENAGGVAHGTVDLQSALQVSSDVFFYIMGAETNVQEGDGGAIQEWARALGLGAPTGLDVGGEGTGRCRLPRSATRPSRRTPTPTRPAARTSTWPRASSPTVRGRSATTSTSPSVRAICRPTRCRWRSPTRRSPTAARSCARTWACGSRIPQGRAIQEIDPAPRRELDIDPIWQQTIMAGLHDAAMAPGGTSYPIFGGYPVDIAGKTGTAERPPYGDQSWYVAVAPYDDPKYVVAVTIEEGGFGADAAAPATLEILNELLNVNTAKIDSVSADVAVVE